jgi:hypothetical protein
VQGWDRHKPSTAQQLGLKVIYFYDTENGTWDIAAPMSCFVANNNIKLFVGHQRILDNCLIEKRNQ